MPGLRRGLGTCSRGLQSAAVSHLDELDELRGRARAAAEEGVQRGLLALPLLRADAGRHVPLQQARPAVRAAARVSVLPAEDGGRLGLGQEPADADDPARRGLRPRATSRSRSSAARARSRRSPPRRSPSGSASRGRRTTSSSARAARRPMLLAIDVGNTQTVFGLFDGDRADRAVPGRHRSARTPPTSSRSCCARSSTSRRSTGSCSRSSVPQLVREYEAFAERWAGVDLLVLGPGRLDRDADPLRRPARGRARPDRERGRGARAARRAGDRRRLRHLDELRRRLGRRASSPAACSRPGSRSRWTRSSRVPRACRRCRSWRPSA